MKSKEQIFNLLKKTRQDNYGSYLDGPPPEVLTLEVLIDIRDHISTMINVLISLREELIK